MARIKVLTSLVGRLSLSVSCENGPERRLKSISFNPKLPGFKQTAQTLIRRHVLRRLIWVYTVCQCLKSGFTDNTLHCTLTSQRQEQRGYKYKLPGVCTTRGWISLVNAIHVDNYLKEIFCVCILWLDCKQSTPKYSTWYSSVTDTVLSSKGKYTVSPYSLYEYSSLSVDIGTF